MVLLNSPADISPWLREWAQAQVSYAHKGGVEAPPLAGFIVDVHRVRLGLGVAVYQRACAALDGWQMFPEWTRVHRDADGQHAREIVAMVVRICGLWWVNPCRILRRCDSDHTHGFVYGTLPEHAECGEERFMVEMLPDGSVWYEIRAFSRPRHWLAWAGFPLARWWQLQFAHDSQVRMKETANPPTALLP